MKNLKYDGDLLIHLTQTGNRVRDNGHGYPVISVGGKDVKVHHLILPPKEGFIVDHINRDKWDCRTKNLRYVTHLENNNNRGAQKNNTTGYPGVYQQKRDKKYRAVLRHNYKRFQLGTHEKLEDAIAAKIVKEKELGVFYECDLMALEEVLRDEVIAKVGKLENLASTVLADLLKNL